jgi:dihydroflavonol-4-reductase
MKQKAWIAGATGFLGSHLASLLKEQGWDASLTSRSGGDISGQVVHAVDILDERAVEESAKGATVAFLCTGLVSRDPEDAGTMHRLHVLGTRSCLSALKRAGVKKVVVAGTSGTVAVGRDPSAIYDENSPAPMEYIAAWPYYRTKYYGEQEALGANTQEFEVIVVCPSLLLGPGDLRESSTGDVRKFLEKSVPATPAGGLAFVDVRDAAMGMLLALEKGRGGERYLLNAANMTVSSFFSRLSRMSGVKAPLMTMPRSTEMARGIFSLYEQGLRALGGTPPVDAMSAEMGQHFWYCSAEKAERELGFVARDPGETLRDTLQDLVDRKVVAPPEMRHRGGSN